MSIRDERKKTKNVLNGNIYLSDRSVGNFEKRKEIKENESFRALRYVD